jgi:hypothetical protein
VGEGTSSELLPQPTAALPCPSRTPAFGGANPEGVRRRGRNFVVIHPHQSGGHRVARDW